MLEVENIRKISDLSRRGQSFLIRREIKSSIPVNIIVKTFKQVEERIKMSDFFINLMSN
jgi:hypothetical protein